MAAVDVLNSAGKKGSERQLSDEIFSTPVKTSVLHRVVRSQLVAKREGTASCKTRGTVKGSTRKLFRQKGTGNARAGSIKSPLRKGGGIIFGPSPRSYEIKDAVEKNFNTKVKQVRTIQVKGKVKQRGKIIGKRKDWKKAIITLMPGQKIDFFEGV